MMISDEERREVAARFRALDYSDLQESLICAYLDALGIKGYTDWVGIAHCLADLIEPGDPRVRCVAEVKIDGERLEELVHDAAVELTGIDRDALLALAEEMDTVAASKETYTVPYWYLDNYAERIREALGVEK